MEVPISHADDQTVGASVRYLGQVPPGTTPVRFAPGIVSTPAIEINGAFRPDFQEFFFARQLAGVFTLFRSTLTGDRWSDAQPLSIFPGGAAGVAVDMAYSPNGGELFFLGRFKPGVPPMEAPLDIWVTRYRDGRWAAAEMVAAPVSTDAFESYPSVVADGSLYFSSNRPGGLGGSDIWRAPRRPDGSFGVPVNVGSPVNAPGDEGDAFASPDERYLIITANRTGGFGRHDLYVSFRAADGSWGSPLNLGATINTADTEFCPMVTPDGRYLLFSRMYGGGTWETTTDADVFWVDMSVVLSRSGSAQGQTQTSPVPATPQNAGAFVGEWTIATSTGPLGLIVRVVNAIVVGEVTTPSGTHHATFKIGGRSLLAGYDFDEQGVSSDAVLVLTPNDKEKRVDAHVDFANGAPRLTGTATKK